MTLHVLTGPPCAGKSRYIRDHAADLDVVIDFDTLAHALGYPHPHVDWWETRAHPARTAAAVARVALLSAARTGRFRACDTWVVETTISPEAQLIYTSVGAHVIPLDPGPDECHRRADADARSPSTHEQIDRWYANLGVTSEDW